MQITQNKCLRVNKSIPIDSEYIIEIVPIDRLCLETYTTYVLKLNLDLFHRKLSLSKHNMYTNIVIRKHCYPESAGLWQQQGAIKQINQPLNMRLKLFHLNLLNLFLSGLQYKTHQLFKISSLQLQHKFKLGIDESEETHGI